MPDRLAEQVKALELSVSPICQAALQEEVLKMQAIETATRDLKKVANRLRSTFAKHEVEARRQGLADGTRWAREAATVGELRRMASLRREYGRLQLPLEPGVNTYLQQLWQNRFRDDTRWAGWDVDSETYLEGFAEAATTVYNAVVPLL